MSATPSEVTLFALERFWRHIKSAERVASSRAEAALGELARGSGDVRSRTWCALLLHATFVDTALVCDVLDALDEQSADGRPPARLLDAIGFAHWRGGHVALDAPVDTSSDLEASLRQLRAIPALNNQAVSEILLALAGTKISRLTAPASVIRLVSEALDYPVFIASRSLAPVVDLALSGFSNQASDGGPVYDLAGDKEVYAYFGSDLADLGIVSVLDRLNAAGSFLDIPACCRSFFSATWESCQEQHSGDLAFTLLSSHRDWGKGRSLKISWQCNPYGMYMGGGLLWHFPCSSWCEHTIAVVDSRLRLLERVDSEFAAECCTFQQRAFRLFPDRRFQLGIDGHGGVLVQPT
ncbi:MAG: hypothetical protein KDI51_05325 [Xanthomonadales bacterium]|nr:hypothetical protein [Xanthomonadales bacterium]